jgi:alginate O-acetyltransferase complex protein AlgJ
MLHHYRRYWALAAAMLLALPLIVGLVAPGGRTVSTNEARVLAPAPSFPNSLAGWLSMPKQTDAYLRDHFGLRQVFLRAYGMIMSRALKNSGNPFVLTGPNGWMFLRADDMVQQSAGLVRRDARVKELADLLAEMRTALAARGTRLLVASPPNSATIYVDELPLWARNRGQRTEYDLLLDELAQRGILDVDLRLPLIAAAARGKVYRMHDTHWMPSGALAAFNAIARVDGHPDWTLDPSSALGAPDTIVGGDLARLLGVEADVTEAVRPLILPSGNRELFGSGPTSTYLVKSQHRGPTIMIIGDSFTEDLFAPMVLQHAGQVVWVYHQSCRFDWKWIDQFRPDEIWWMPTERFLACRHGDRPAGFPPAGAIER